MISPARPNKDFGTVTPIALAVLRLITLPEARPASGALSVRHLGRSTNHCLRLPPHERPPDDASGLREPA